MQTDITLLDHGLALAFAIGFPTVATPLYLKRRASLLAGDPGVRIREYQETIAWLAGMGLATLLVWTAMDRPWASLGLKVPATWRTTLCLALALTLVVLIVLQVRGVFHDDSARSAAREALEPVREFMPASDREARWFRGVALSAGIGEEIFYRGFLLWYLPQVIPLLAAVAVSSAFFGLAHIMHGPKAALRATIMGALLAGLYLVGGSLLAPMLVHAAIDLGNGAIGRAAFAEDPG